MIKIVISPFLAVLLVTFAVGAQSSNEETIDAYKLSYVEREPGVDEYPVTLLVTDRYVRLDEEGENSGYILYDDKTKVIYSVSHVDNSTLIIKEHKFSEKDSPVKGKTEYLQLADAPKVSDNDIYNFRLYIEEAANQITCMEIQLVENILPEVRQMLRNYQKVVSGQQVRMTDNVVSEVQGGCYFVDQVYNTGAYYDKGLPIQEWHSNERARILTSYKKVKVSADKFVIPEGYREFSIDSDMKTSIN